MKQRASLNSIPMAMPTRGRVSLFFLTFALHFTNLFSTNTLLQGVTFTRYESLISPSQVYKFHFFYDTQKIYLGITFNDEDRVWLANYNIPLDENSSPSLIIDDYGNLKIQYNDGEGSIVLYSSGETYKINAIVVLRDTGNLELREINSNDSAERVLWQSFDYPNNILLPGMKLGMNHKTGQRWSLTSWVAPNTPVLGSFTLGMDPNNTNQLVMWWKGDVFWTSGELRKDGTFPYLKSKKLISQQRSYFFIRHENEDETCFVYVENMDDEPGAIVLSLEGELFGVVSVMCHGYNHEFVSGCVALKPPSCRNPEARVTMLSSERGFMYGMGYKEEDDHISLYDCGVMCLNSCSCYAYSSITEDHTGCQMWNKGTTFFQHSSGPPVYFIANDVGGNGSPEAHQRKMRTLWIVSVVAVVTLIQS